MNKNQILLSLGLIVIAAATRFLPHPPNFTAVGAMAIFGGAILSKRWMAIAFPLVVLFLSDLVLNNTIYASFYDGFTWFTSGAVYLYGAFVITAFMGMRLNADSKWSKTLGVSVSSSLVFFALSNFGVWMGSAMYSKDLAGLMTAYAAGVPFFWSTLVSTAVFTQVLFVAYRYSERKIEATV